MFDCQGGGDGFRMVIGDVMDGFRDDSFDESGDLVQFVGVYLIRFDGFYRSILQNCKKISQSPAQKIQSGNGQKTDLDRCVPPCGMDLPYQKATP